MKKSLVFLLLFWTMMVHLAYAGDYQLIIGEGVDVCETCKRNLERMTDHPACERDYSGQLGLEALEWKPFDVAGHLGTMEQVMKYLATGNEFAESEYITAEDLYDYTIRRIGTREEPWAYWALVDINNDGTLKPGSQTTFLPMQSKK